MLFRAAHHSDLLEVELTRRNIPFVKYGGLKFLEAAHVKDALAILRVLENPRDEVAWFRVLQLPEGIGPATARRLMETIGVRATDDEAASPLVASSTSRSRCPRRRSTACRSCARRCADAPTRRCSAPAAQIERLRAFLAPVFARRYDAAGGAPARPRPARGCSPPGYEARGAVPRRAHARPAVDHRRPRRTAAARRGLARALHDPLGQGPRVGRRARDPRRRRHDPVRHGDRRRRRDRGGAPPALRRAHASARRAARVPPAALLPPAPRATRIRYSQLSRFLEPTRSGRRSTSIGPQVDPRDDAVVDIGAATVDVDAYLAGLWSE